MNQKILPQPVDGSEKLAELFWALYSNDQYAQLGLILNQIEIETRRSNDHEVITREDSILTYWIKFLFKTDEINTFLARLLKDVKSQFRGSSSPRLKRFKGSKTQLYGVERVFTLINSSLFSLPSEVTAICQKLYSEVKAKFGQKAGIESISGILYLRLILSYLINNLKLNDPRREIIKLVLAVVNGNEPPNLSKDDKELFDQLNRKHRRTIKRLFSSSSELENISRQIRLNREPLTESKRKMIMYRISKLTKSIELTNNDLTHLDNVVKTIKST